MAREINGGAYVSRGRAFMRITTARGVRTPKALPWVTAEQLAKHDGDKATPCACVACVRAREVQALVNRLREAGQQDFVENLVKSGASAGDDDTGRAKMAELALAVDGIAGSAIVKAKPKVETAKDTIRGIGERWTDGELHRLHPDHVRDKRTAKDDEYRLELLCETGIGAIPVSRFTLDDADAAMRDIDAARQRVEDRRAQARGGPPRRLAPLAPAARRQYAQMISRICAMAVYPLRLITVSPIPKGWLPRVSNDKAKGLVYPDEERAFLADASIPIQWRMFFGALARLGFRADEAAGLSISDVDVARGIVVLDENKTDDPRAPAYGEVPGLVEALTWWKEAYRADAEGDEPFFVQPNGERIRVDGLAHRYRTMLETTLRGAGLYRADLFIGGERRMRLRVHDLRGAFVTYALANGRTETWVQDRTGHRSSHMVNRYRRVARTVLEAELGDLTPLDEAIPEFAATSNGCEVAAEVAAAKGVDGRTPRMYWRKRNNGPIAQSVELRTFNRDQAPTLEDFRDVAAAKTDAQEHSRSQQPLRAAVTAASPIDPVEAALAAGVSAVAASMATAAPSDLVALADRMAALARELEARRVARAGAVDLDEERRRRARKK